MTIKKPPTSRKLVRQTAGPVDKRRRKRGLTTAVKTAIDAMIFGRCSRAEACKTAGFTERALYLALEKAEVAQYWNRQLLVLRAGERAANIHRLCEIRDAADNMPAVNAVKTLEQLDAEAVARPVSQVSPGIVIRVLNVSAPAAVSSFVEKPSDLTFRPFAPLKPPLIDG
jgi:hypothetical protein